MIGQARFTYTSSDMVAAQRAAWTWLAQPRYVVVLALVIAVGEALILTALNLHYHTRGVPEDPAFVALTAAVLAPCLIGLLLTAAMNHGTVVLRSLRMLPKSTWAGHGNAQLLSDQDWFWDRDGLHTRTERDHADLPWASIGAWLDTPTVVLFYPTGSRPFMSKTALPTEWRTAPSLFLMPLGDTALALPKRTLTSGDVDRLIDALRAAGVPERKRFGLLAAKNSDGIKPPAGNYCRAFDLSSPSSPPHDASGMKNAGF